MCILIVFISFCAYFLAFSKTCKMMFSKSVTFIIIILLDGKTSNVHVEVALYFISIIINLDTNTLFDLARIL